MIIKRLRCETDFSQFGKRYLNSQRRFGNHTAHRVTNDYLANPIHQVIGFYKNSELVAGFVMAGTPDRALSIAPAELTSVLQEVTPCAEYTCYFKTANVGIVGSMVVLVTVLFSFIRSGLPAVIYGTTNNRIANHIASPTKTIFTGEHNGKKFWVFLVSRKKFHAFRVIAVYMGRVFIKKLLNLGRKRPVVS